MMRNGYELAARQRKVTAIATHIVADWFSLPESQRVWIGVDDVLRGLPQKTRDAFAAVAGQRTPSAETWEQVAIAVQKAIDIARAARDRREGRAA